MATLHLPSGLRSTLASWAAAAYPAEGCGLLVGDPPAAERSDHLIKKVTWASNINRERAHDRYEVDPHDLLEADLAARAAGLAVLGVWHTHPDHPAQPSETDRLAAWPEWSYLILAVTGDGLRELRSWRLNAAQQFDEEEIAS